MVASLTEGPADLRFQAATLLGRIYRERGLLPRAIEWFEHAAEAAAPTATGIGCLIWKC